MKKKGTYFRPIPKISPKSNFFLKTGYRTGYNRNRPVTGTLVLPGSRFRFRFPKTRNRGTPVPVPGFGQKPGNRTGLTPLLFSVGELCHTKATILNMMKILNKLIL